MKKSIVIMMAAAMFATALNAAPNGKSVKIGIAKIVQHPALDAVEQGVIDAINDAGFDAKY